MKIRALIWDEWNVKHIKKHRVTPGEAEKILKDRKKKVLCSYKQRLLLLGEVKGRFLTVVLAKKEGGVYYVVTARDMSKKERRFYKSE